MRPSISSLIILLLFAVLLSCKYYEHNFPYNFEKGKILELRNELKEISGISYGGDEVLYAVQDEVGKIYRIDLKSGEQKSYISFKKKGDFEGIAKVDEYFYVLRSDGSIFQVDTTGYYKKYNFPVSSKGYDFEGICVTTDQTKLLIACKEHPNKALNKNINIYQFSLDEMAYLEETFLKIPKESLHKKMKASGISFNHLGNLVLIAANSFTIVEVDTLGNLLRIGQLPFLAYPQVEGICFSPTGTLFLASEKGDQNKAQVVKLEAYEK